MNYLKQLQQGIDYIEAHLDFDIRLEDVASAANLSQWHFQRIFKAATNETLKTYIRTRRLANALEKLLTTNMRIVDIAMLAGFESQESFTRAFKKAFDMTPHAYRKIGNKNLFLKKVQFNTEYLNHIHQNISLEPEIYVQKSLKLVGIKTHFYSVDSEKNNIAEKLPPLWEAILKRMHEIPHLVPEFGYGIIQQTKDKTDLLEYYAVFEVEKFGLTPKGMECFEIPETTYAKFTHAGKSQLLNETVNYIYSNWLLQSENRHTYGPDLEIYGDQYHPSSDESIIYYAIPIL